MKNLIIYISAAVLLLACTKVYIEDNDQNMDAFFYVDFEGAQMPVLVEGNIPSGKFIIVVHGGPGGNGMSYIGTPSIEKLEEDFAVVYYNQRLSDGSIALNNGEYIEPSRAQYAEDLNAIINTLKSKYGDSSQFYLLGHSWGGELVTEFMSTSSYQDQVNGMINVSGLLRISDSERERSLYMRELLIEISTIEIAEGDNLERWTEIYDYCIGIDTSEIEQHGLTLWNYGWDVSQYLTEEGKIVSKGINGFETIDIAPLIANGNGSSDGVGSPSGILISMNPSNFLNPDNVTERNSQMDGLLNITKPSLIISGKYDVIVPPALSELLFDNIATPLSDKSYYELDSTDHGPYNRGQEFYHLVHTFVDQY